MTESVYFLNDFIIYCLISFFFSFTDELTMVKDIEVLEQFIGKFIQFIFSFFYVFGKHIANTKGYHSWKFIFIIW